MNSYPICVFKNAVDCLSNLFSACEYAVQFGRFYFIFSYVSEIFDLCKISSLLVYFCIDHIPRYLIYYSSVQYATLAIL